MGSPASASSSMERRNNKWLKRRETWLVVFLEDDFFSSNGQISCYGKDISNPVDSSLLAQLQQHGYVHTLYILNKLISFCAKSSLFYMGIQAHSTVIKMGFNSNVYINSALVDMYGKCDFISCAQQLFDEMPYRNIVTWNLLFSAYSHTQYPKMAIELFLEMFKGKMFQTPFSVSIALVGCVQLENGELGVQVHYFCLKPGFYFNNEADPLGAVSLIFVRTFQLSG